MTTDLLGAHDRPVPASYRVAAVVVTLVVLMSFATVRWAPWFVTDSAWLVSYGRDGFWTVRESTWLVLGVAFALPVMAAPWLAFRWPVFATVIALLPAVVTWMDGTGVAMHFGTFAGLGAVALTTTWRQPAKAVATTFLAVLVAWIWLMSDKDMVAPFGAIIDLRHTQTWSIGPTYTLALLFVLGLGLVLRRSAAREMQRRRLAAREDEVADHAAVVAERARLARDLHDVVAHHVSLIAVRAETAPYTEPELGDAGRRVLSDVAADARLALDELRGVLGILGRAGEAERSPQPSLADVAALVERTRRSGQDVTLVGDVRATVGGGAGYAAYRVVQEALTNARRHAPGAAVEVAVEVTSRLLEVRVSNPVAEAPTGLGTGRGLVGMRERVEALGGRLRIRAAGPVFEVEATLPARGEDV